MNIQLKNLKYVLSCKGISLKRSDILEQWEARISDFESYSEMYISQIEAVGDRIILSIQKEPLEI